MRNPAVRYAKAFFSLARAQGVLDALLADVEALARLIRESPELASFLGDYSVPRARRAQVLETLFASRLQPFTWRCLRFAEEKRRLGILDSICAVLRDMQDREAGIQHVLLVTAAPLDDGDRRLLSDHISGKAGGPVTMSESVDPGLLGGFRVQIDDTLYDLSLSRALECAKEKLLQGV